MLIRRSTIVDVRSATRKLSRKDFVSTRRVPMILSGILAYNCVCRKATCDTIRTTCHHYPYHSFIGSLLSSV